MGYYSSFYITPQLLPAEIKRLTEISGGYGFENYGNETTTDDSYKWYAHEDNMVKFSKEFPHNTWRLIGHGEDGEKWAVFVNNGRKHVVRQPEFNPPTPAGF